MDDLKDQVVSFIWVIIGEIFTIGGAVVSIGGLSKLEFILLNITLLDYMILGLKTLILGMIGALGGLVMKWIWGKIFKHDK